MHRTFTMLVLAGTVTLAAAVAMSACSEPAPAPAATTTPAPVADVSPAHGKYLVDSHGCHDCHTPWKMGPKGPEPDMTRMLSGHPEAVKVTAMPSPMPAGGYWIGAMSADNTAWAGPWGVSFTANLTPDQNTGIGIWTEKMFMDALRTGKHMGTATSRDILPPMPWEPFGKMNDDDLKAVFAYLKSIPPIANHVPDPLPPPGAGKHGN
jgi:hypothetical protein